MNKFQLGKGWISFCPLCGKQLKAANVGNGWNVCLDCHVEFLIFTSKFMGPGSKTNKTIKTCKSKIYHPTLKSAYEHFMAIKDKPSDRQGILQVYRCPVCDGYHIGHKVTRGYSSLEVYEEKDLRDRLAD